MKDVTAHITLSRSLESDINLFRAWEADKYDFRVLDALIREFYGIYGLEPHSSIWQGICQAVALYVCGRCFLSPVKRDRRQ